MVARRHFSPALFLCAVAIGVAGCGDGTASTSDLTAALRFDPCAPLTLILDADATATERAGARAAIDQWHAVAAVHATLAPNGAGASSGATLSVRYLAAAAPDHGVFDPASAAVFVNDDLAAEPAALAVTIAHELGHAFGLLHVIGRASVMNPGNLTITPDAADAAALVAAWGVCPTDAP
ncbi:MAG TPA: hypothetical protein VHJ20_09490 [Polyangia bacterium]|nr:hypothetical protein [Polyangia bacterium]